LEFKILGTGSATPQLDRNPSAFFLTIDQVLFLIDCGEGTQFRILEHKIKVSRLKYIMISHLHGDHYFGLVGLISSLNLNKRKEPLTIIGPKGLNEILILQFKYSNTILNFELSFIETQSDTFNLVLDTETFKIESFPLKHRVPCTGFLITKKTSKRKVIRESLPENFPLPYYKLLKDGLDVTNELTGEVFLNKNHTADGEPEKKIAYCSDTIFDTGIVEYIKNADLVYHEATFLDEHEQRAQQTFHSTASQAAQIANLANAKQLIIGHYSSRYKTTDSHLQEANIHFDAVNLSKEGDNYII
jgi:ribonuclease Z